MENLWYRAGGDVRESFIDILKYIVLIKSLYHKSLTTYLLFQTTSIIAGLRLSTVACLFKTILKTLRQLLDQTGITDPKKHGKEIIMHIGISLSQSIRKTTTEMWQ